MAGVVLEFRPLAVVQGSRDCERMQAELLAEHGKVAAVGVSQVQPDDGAIREVIADVSNREALELQPAVPVQPRTRLAPGRADLADGRRLPRLWARPACSVREAGAAEGSSCSPGFAEVPSPAGQRAPAGLLQTGAAGHDPLVWAH
jgi:hypothetical protein